MNASNLPLLVLVHGWGYDATVWDGVCAALPDFETLRVELGYFGAPRADALPERPALAVGHSLGVLWLLATRPFAWRGLISINGFPRFTEAPGYAPAVPARLVTRMRRRLEEHPAVVVEEFRRRCGDPSPLPGKPDPARLAAGLEALCDWDAREGPPETPLLALSGDADPILPPGMAAHCFLGFPDAAFNSYPGGGHLLPLEQPGWCAGHIARFAQVAAGP